MNIKPITIDKSGVDIRISIGGITYGKLAILTCTDGFNQNWTNTGVKYYLGNASPAPLAEFTTLVSLKSGENTSAMGIAEFAINVNGNMYGTSITPGYNFTCYIFYIYKLN